MVKCKALTGSVAKGLMDRENDVYHPSCVTVLYFRSQLSLLLIKMLIHIQCMLKQNDDGKESV